MCGGARSGNGLALGIGIGLRCVLGVSLWGLACVLAGSGPATAAFDPLGLGYESKNEESDGSWDCNSVDRGEVG